MNVFLDKEGLLPGQKGAEARQNVIKESKYFLMLLSKNAIEKNTYIQDFKPALEKLYQQQNEISIIPITLDNSQIPESIQNLNIINFFPDWNLD